MDKKIKKNRHVNKGSIILIVGIILLMIPVLIFGWIIVSAALDTGTPILGERYKNDLDPSINKEHINSIKDDIKSIGGVDSVDIQLATATLRIYIDTNDEFDAAKEEEIAREAYNKVNSQLDINTYFTQTEDKKMYDLEIHVFNLGKDRDTDKFAYQILTKTSSMKDFKVQLVSEPKDPELAKQLVDEMNAPEVEENTNQDITVNSEEAVQEENTETTNE